MKSIEHTWEQVRAGSTQGWTSLVRLLSPVVYSVARRWGLSVSDAEDVAQQTWLALYERRDQIEDPAALPAWLIRVVSRKAQRRNRRRFRDNDLRVGSNLNEERLPDEELLALERLAILRLAMTRLDERCRRLVEELFLSDPRKSYQEIARDLGLKPNSLGPIRSRCLQKLRRIFEDFDI